MKPLVTPMNLFGTVFIGSAQKTEKKLLIKNPVRV